MSSPGQMSRSLKSKRQDLKENRLYRKFSQKEISDTEDKFDDEEVLMKSKPRRSLRRAECKERTQMPCIEKQMARITKLQPLRARIQSINSSPEDQVTQGRIDPSVHGLISTGVPACYQSKTKEENPKIFQTYHPQVIYQYSIVHLYYYNDYPSPLGTMLKKRMTSLSLQRTCTVMMSSTLAWRISHT